MTGAFAPGPRAAGAQRIDWRRAAELLAQGFTVTETARQLGCSRSSLSRRRKRDPGFQQLIEEQRALAHRQGERIDGLRRVLTDAIEQEVRNGNVRVILWLADRLKLVTPVDERTPENELRSLLGSLGPDELREFEDLR